MVEALVAFTRAGPLRALGVVHALPHLRAVPLHRDALGARAVAHVVPVLALAQPPRAARAFRARHALPERLARPSGRDFRIAGALVREEAELTLAGGSGQGAVGVVHALSHGGTRGSGRLLPVAGPALFVEAVLAFADSARGRGALGVLHALAFHGAGLAGIEDGLALEVVAVEAWEAVAAAAVWRGALGLLSALASLEARLTRGLGDQ